RLERLAGAVDRDCFELDAEPAGKRAGKIDRDARRCAGRVELHEHRIADIDGGAQPAGWGEFLYELGWNAGHGVVSNRYAAADAGRHSIHTMRSIPHRR